MMLNVTVYTIASPKVPMTLHYCPYTKSNTVFFLLLSLLFSYRFSTLISRVCVVQFCLVILFYIPQVSKIRMKIVILHMTISFNMVTASF